MAQHLLVTLSKRRKYTEVPSLPPGAEYNKEKGVWLLDGNPLIKHELFLDGQVSKKCDQETGEDQKGE